MRVRRHDPKCLEQESRANMVQKQHIMRPLTGMNAAKTKHLSLDRRISVAPMMDWTDRHCRNFMRLISPGVLLYTEMVTAAAILHGDRRHLLHFFPDEKPLALQLGGSDPAELAEASTIAEQYGYDEINLNIGCPSDRVQSGRFGACLMIDPALVARCVKAMREAVDLPVTVKTRTGIDDWDDYEFLAGFVTTVAESGCRVFIVHARKAILEGLSPKENRAVPPLRYDYVYRLKDDNPGLEIVLNGGVQSLDDIDDHLQHVDGVMIGRHAYHDPYWLVEVENRYFRQAGDWVRPTREQILEGYLPYVEARLAEGARLKEMARHMLGLYAAQPGARRWRRYLSEHAHLPEAGVDVIRSAMVAS